jgi:chaperonin GroES
MKSKLIAVGERVIIKPLSLEKKQSVIIIPNADKAAPEFGEVVSIGPAANMSDVKIGSKVFFDKYGFDILKVDGEDMSVGNASGILAILQ